MQHMGLVLVPNPNKLIFLREKKNTIRKCEHCISDVKKIFKYSKGRLMVLHYVCLSVCLFVLNTLREM